MRVKAAIMIKLIMTWNIREGRETEYLEFLTQDFTRLIGEMGVQPLDAWYSAWGQGPQVIAGGVTKDLETMEKALETETWKKIQEKIAGFAVDFKCKVVEATGGFQL
jgi:hypothetical protein